MLGEMLIALTSVSSNRPMFLSPDFAMTQSLNFFNKDQTSEHLIMILQLLGKQDDDSLAFLTDQKPLQ